MTPVALTIAGSDPSGGAGLQADLKTFHQFGVYGMSVATLLTVQNTRCVSAVELLAPQFVAAQLDACLSDIPPAAAKTGALGDAALIELLAQRAADFAFPLVVDPVMVSKHGDALLPPNAAEALAGALLPRATLVTPNIPEAEALTGLEIRTPQDMEAAARALVERGPRAVLVKGGAFSSSASVDVLCIDGRVEPLESSRIDTVHTHGTGCVLSAAITAGLARGVGLVDAVRAAKRFVAAAIKTAPGLGAGRGPVNMHAERQ